MFTFGRNSLPPKCLSQCGLCHSNSCHFSLPAPNKPSSSTRNQDMELEQPAEGTRDVTAALVASLWRKQERLTSDLNRAREACQRSTSLQPQQEVRNLRGHVYGKNDDQQKWPQQQNIFFYDAVKLSRCQRACFIKP